MKKSFTLIEILVVATIVALLAAAAFVSYSQFSKQARDARRKTDLEQVRAALEMYRSNNDTYPTDLGNLTGPTIYMNNVPQDPMVTQGYSYQYEALPAGCSNNCSDFTLGAFLENTSSCNSLPSANCKGVSNCNYCIGPYGQK